MTTVNPPAPAAPGRATTSSVSILNEESAIINTTSVGDEKIIKDTWSKTFVDRFDGAMVFESIRGTANGLQPKVSLNTILRHT